VLHTPEYVSRLQAGAGRLKKFCGHKSPSAHLRAVALAQSRLSR